MTYSQKRERMEVASIITKELLVEPKTPKQLVKACAKEGVKRSSVFYWLKKLRREGTIRKIEGKYQLVKFEDASREEIGFLIEKMRDENPHVRKAAIEDFTLLCRERRVTSDARILPFITELMKNPIYPELKRSALKFLRFVVVNSKRTEDIKALEELATFKKPLEDLVLDGNADQSLRHDATIVLDVLLDQDEGSRLMQLLKHVMEESAEKPEGEDWPFQVMGLYLWHSILKRFFPTEKRELRVWLYNLLKNENNRVREMSLNLLSELRMKEYGFELL